MNRFSGPLSLLVTFSIALDIGGMVPRAVAVSSSATLAGTVYFTRAGLLYGSNPDGSSARALTSLGKPKTPDEMPAVSRDGTHVAYVQWQQVSHDQPYGVYMLNPHGKPTNISRADQFPFFPAWSPDGTELIYGTTVYYFSASYSELIIRRVADDKPIDLIGNVNAPPSDPTWSPDGRTIVIDQLSRQGSNFVDGLQALDYAKMLASGQPKTEIEHPLTNDASHNYMAPSYSPDGRFIACVRTGLNSSDGDLWVMNADGSGGHMFAHDAHHDRPAWSPDGSAIAITRGTDIAIVSARTGTLLASIPNATGPAWGSRVSARPISPSKSGNASPSASPTPPAVTSSVSRTPAVTVTSAGLFHLVGATYQATQLVYQGEDVLYAVYYHTTGIDPSSVSGSLSFIYNGKAEGAFPLTAGTAADGTPVLTSHLKWPSNKGLKATRLGAQFTVHWRSLAQHTTVWFVLEP